MKERLFRQSVRLGFVIGAILALYISLSMFWRMPYNLWLALNNLLVVTSLVLAAFVGYRHRALAVSFKFMLLTVAVFFSVIMLLYIVSYIVTTGFFPDQMAWIPFFYRDYNYHGFTSVSDYLNHRDNYQELLKLQIFSLMIASVMYFAAGSSGYGVNALIERIRHSFGRTRSTV